MGLIESNEPLSDGSDMGAGSDSSDEHDDPSVSLSAGTSTHGADAQPSAPPPPPPPAVPVNPPPLAVPVVQFNDPGIAPPPVQAAIPPPEQRHEQQQQPGPHVGPAVQQHDDRDEYEHVAGLPALADGVFREYLIFNILAFLFIHTWHAIAEFVVGVLRLFGCTVALMQWTFPAFRRSEPDDVFEAGGPPNALDGLLVTEEQRDRVAASLSACSQFAAVTETWKLQDTALNRRLTTNVNVTAVEGPMWIRQIRLDFPWFIPEWRYGKKRCWLSFLIFVFCCAFGAPYFVKVFSLLVSVWYCVHFVTRHRPMFCPYVPHLVSCVLLEFDHDTSYAVAKQQVRPKIRRLAALPIQDVDAVALIKGSELVILTVLDDPNFCEMGAKFMAN